MLRIFTMMTMALMVLLSNQESMNEVTKNGMTVGWEHRGGRISFEMTAPTNGWVTIGFNSTTAMTGSYLLMGRVISGKAQVVEHYTESPGNYYPIAEKGMENNVWLVAGKEISGKTTLKFSLPKKPANEYTKNLELGSKYVMHMAYSTSDDFQHHSMMRTSIKIKL